MAPRFRWSLYATPPPSRSLCQVFRFGYLGNSFVFGPVRPGSSRSRISASSLGWIGTGWRFLFLDHAGSVMMQAFSRSTSFHLHLAASPCLSPV